MTRPISLRLAWGVCLLTAGLLAGCGGGGDKGEKASQTAAKVNKEEITVHQINFVLQQQRGLKPEQAEAASKQILERLIDQELALQKALEQKLDREPRVVQQIEAARVRTVKKTDVRDELSTAAEAGARMRTRTTAAHAVGPTIVEVVEGIHR